jgi:hypothetical protein
MDASAGGRVLEVGRRQPLVSVHRLGCEGLRAQFDKAHGHAHDDPASKSERYGSNTKRRLRA